MAWPPSTGRALHVENVRRHFIDRLSPRPQSPPLEEIKASFAPIVEYLRKILDRD